ncbi:hypothetical protein FHW88_002507 [Mucilaginibacter sp. SG538B]|uniref:hypothetical protein n=1 Tax=Mucilaginibacter sp. SG538B TaxID=2587021 RepID=UPI00159D525E|nr:hypothetical protein [Mucilaginibacter sp. SG538B]NVM64179.1 hypothetical protein [Mucilaginibacter sp. SG538B]NVM64218.1 hypothetical protein [Mucilaginibacter sp. SG538B]
MKVVASTIKDCYWKILLTEWRLKGGDGLTIPFLIGAQKYFANCENPQEIKDLIVDIATNKDLDVYIGYCMTIKELILGVRSGSKLNIAGNHVILGNGTVSCFFLTKFVDDLGTCLSEITNTLTEKYQPFIAAKQYSVNQTIWGSYTADELDFIQDCSNK